MLINAYCTCRKPGSLDFSHKLNSRRDRSDAELADHLNGFIGFILDRGNRKMTQSLYHVMRHIERVQHHLSLEVEDDDLDAFAQWAWNANAILFLEDGSVRDPSGEVLVNPENGESDEEAQIPYPDDAHERKARNDTQLAKLAVKVPPSLPPVIGEGEVELRPAHEVGMRATCLFIVAVRAEALATNAELSVADLQKSFPAALEWLTSKELEFLKNSEPEQQDVINFAWQYECLAVLEWALGLCELPLPTQICDVPQTAKLVRNTNFAKISKLRPTAEILDALDLHYRLHWAVRQAGLDEQDPPASLDPGVVQERHRTLNWLVRFEDADWDDVDAPT
jgi:hypothetical protein